MRRLHRDAMARVVMTSRAFLFGEWDGAQDNAVAACDGKAWASCYDQAGGTLLSV